MSMRNDYEVICQLAGPNGVWPFYVGDPLRYVGNVVRIKNPNGPSEWWVAEFENGFGGIRKLYRICQYA